MEEPRYAGRLYGDISAMTQTARAGAALAQVIEREDWHPRLLNGSDYPLPGVVPLVNLGDLARRGLIEPDAVPLLSGLRKANVLLYDFVLKRSLAMKGRAFPAGVFETAPFFAARA